MVCNNEITFTSAINFVSTEKFKKIWHAKIKPENLVDSPWTFKEAKISNNFAGTYAVNTCTSLNLARSAKMQPETGAEALLLHLVPDRENFLNFHKFFEPYRNLPDDYEFSSVLLIGSKSPLTPGIDPKMVHPSMLNQIYDKNSSKLFKKIEAIFKRFQPTIFQGHSGANTASSYIYDVKNDIYYINTKLDIYDCRSSVKNFSDVKKAFDRVEISPRDKVSFIV